MKPYTVNFFVLILACITSLGSSAIEENQSLILPQQRDFDLLANTRKLVEELAENLRKSAQQAVDAIGTFSNGIQEQLKSFKDKVTKHLDKLRQRVSQAIQNINDRFTNSGTAVKECIDSNRKKADHLYNDTLSKTLSCADQRVTELSKQIDDLKALAKSALEFANNAMLDMRNCTEQNSGNILTAGACLGTVAVKTEMKGSVFTKQSGLSIARINLALVTLPAALEVCAGARLVEAGVGTARIVLEIGSCSASSVFSTLIGNGSN